MKVKKSILILMSAMILSVGLVGCSSEESTTTESSNSSTEQTATKEETKNTDGKIGNYVVKVKSSEQFTDYEGNKALKVVVDFTNNGEEAASFYGSIVAKAFQDGVEIDRVFDTEKLGDNDMKEIKPGATIEVPIGFKLSNEENSVEVEIEEFFSLTNEKVTETINLQ